MKTTHSSKDRSDAASNMNAAIVQIKLSSEYIWGMISAVAVAVVKIRLLNTNKWGKPI